MKIHENFFSLFEDHDMGKILHKICNFVWLFVDFVRFNSILLIVLIAKK